MTSATAPQWAGKIALSLLAPPAVKVGENFVVQVSAANAKGLNNASFMLSYDATRLQLVDQKEGPFLKLDGSPTVFQAYPGRNKGDLAVSINRTGAAGGVDGSGTLASVTFKAIAKGGAGIGLGNVNFTTKTGGKLEVIPFRSIVEVK